MTTALFVYGSLAPGEPNEPILSKVGGTWAKGSVRGFLYKRGWGSNTGHNGIVIDQRGKKVPGFVFTSAKLDDQWKRLDAFEGKEYQRVLVEVEMADGTRKNAFIYELAMPKFYFETDRLILRQWREADKPLMREMQTDPDWMINFPFVRTNAMSDRQVEKLTKEIDDLGFGFFALELKETAEFVGFTGLHVPDWEAEFSPCVEIGWGLRKAWWGRGLVSEAAKGCLEFASDELGLEEVLSFTTPGNKKSIAVMERIGLTRVSGGDFMHPKIDPKSPFALHLLYRIKF